MDSVSVWYIFCGLEKKGIEDEVITVHCILCLKISPSLTLKECCPCLFSRKIRKERSCIHSVQSSSESLMFYLDWWSWWFPFVYWLNTWFAFEKKKIMLEKKGRWRSEFHGKIKEGKIMTKREKETLSSCFVVKSLLFFLEIMILLVLDLLSLSCLLLHNLKIELQSWLPQVSLSFVLYILNARTKSKY